MSTRPNSQPAETVRVPSDTVDPALVNRVAEILRRGGVVAAPTDTVYGLLASVNRLDALDRLVGMKVRPEKKPFILLAADWIGVRSVTGWLPSVARSLGERYWPGALTMVLPADSGLPAAVTAAGATVAVRIPGNELLREIVRVTGCAIAAPSANRPGNPPCANAQDVTAEFGEGLDLVLDGGPSPDDRASTLVDCTGRNAQVLREGPIALEATELVEPA